MISPGMEDAVRDYAEGQLASSRIVREGVGLLLAELDQLRARVAELEAGDEDVEWGTRWVGDPETDVEEEMGEEDARRTVERFGDAIVLSRTVRRGPWVEAS